MTTDSRAVDRHELVRRANEHRLLTAIAEHAPVSRSRLAEMTGLSKPTVLGIVAALEATDLIRVVGSSTGGAGRSPMLYGPNPTAQFVIGVDLGGSRVRTALADLDGDVIAEEEEPTVSEGGPAVVEQINRMARSMARHARVPWSKVATASVGCPGVEDSDGTVRLAANIPGLDTVHLRRDLRRALRRPVQVLNDVNAAALGEHAGGKAHACQTFAVLSVGTGVGLGLVIDGRLVAGSRGGAGEIAYLPIGTDPSSPAAHRRGALEVAASGSGVQALLRETLRESPQRRSSTLRTTSSAHDVYAAAADGDPLAADVVQRHARILAGAVLAVAAVVDPEVVLLAGGIGSNPVLLEPVRDALITIAPFPIHVETASLGPRAGVIGAVAEARRRALDEVFAPPTTNGRRKRSHA